jgi:hypothetical protein
LGVVARVAVIQIIRAARAPTIKMVEANAMLLEFDESPLSRLLCLNAVNQQLPKLNFLRSSKAFRTTYFSGR